jgi:hypothetical protein
VNDNLFTEPDPRDRLLEALDAQGQTDAGLALAIAHDLPADNATVLADLMTCSTRAAAARGFAAFQRATGSAAGGLGFRCLASWWAMICRRRERRHRQAARAPNGRRARCA